MVNVTNFKTFIIIDFHNFDAISFLILQSLYTYFCVTEESYFLHISLTYIYFNTQFTFRAFSVMLVLTLLTFYILCVIIIFKINKVSQIINCPNHVISNNCNQ